MAGPPPKDPAQRRRRNTPERGDWVTLPTVDPKKPILKKLPLRGRGGGKWHPRTVAAWKQWQQDPATTQYGPAEIAAAIELAFLHHDMVMGKEKAAEVRLRMDGLGLSAKGKRDLRWRAPTEHAAEEDAPPAETGGPPAEVRRLRAV